MRSRFWKHSICFNCWCYSGSCRALSVLAAIPSDGMAFAFHSFSGCKEQECECACADTCTYMLFFPCCPLLKESTSLIPVPQAQTGKICACGAAVSELQPLLSSQYRPQATNELGFTPLYPACFTQTQSLLSLLPVKAFPG